MAKVKRTIEYSIANWFADGATLEKRLYETWGILKTTESKTIQLKSDDRLIGFASADYGVEGIRSSLRRLF